MILTPQEVRACIYRGQFASLISKLAQNDVFRSLVKLQSSHQNDGTREELVLKFFAYLENGDAYDGSVTEFLNQYMHANKDKFDTRAGEKLFIEAITKIYSFTNGPLIRSGYSLTPLNQLEAILYGAGHIIKTKSNFATPQAGWLNDKQLVASSTKGTNSKTLFTKRNNRAIELLSGEKFSHE